MKGTEVYKSITLGGEFGTDGVIRALYSDQVAQPEHVRTRVERALNRGWESLMELMQVGGAINLDGDILAIGIDNLHLPLDIQQRLQRELSIGVSPREFSQLLSVDLKLNDPDWYDKDWFIHFIAEGFERHLFYVGKKAAPCLLLPSGKQQSLGWLRDSFSNHLNKQY